ncbi:translation initiation factor eIF2B subunit epsilon-like isoform X2 [Brevipalpus obovatus]|uniref:translation initiation factor eIF2B subunit epsilon-like isoform X2 n=1 Tax=Brevipalpus obovatus TaxID=246614 RepID=UPI003D9F3497
MIAKPDQVYQAVVVCDTSRNHFGPIGKRLAPCLIPLIGKSILHFTLDSLKASGIQDVHLFCSLHSDQIRSSIKSYQATVKSTDFKLTVHSSENNLSLGDTIRDIFAKSIINGDFILLYGDTVCNLPFKRLLDEHKSLRAKDKQCVMTLLYQKSSPTHLAKKKSDETLIISDGKSDRLLCYERLRDQEESHSLKYLSIFKSNPNLKIHYDLLDTHISICAPAVISLFYDNFDYQSRFDFIRGIIDQEEILGNTIYVKTFNEPLYAIRAMSPIDYDRVAQDMLNRWTYPLVPDSENQFTYHRHHIYKQESSTIPSDSSKLKNVCIGNNTTIGSRAKITNSVIGSNCRIGENVRMNCVYVLDNVAIENDCHLDSCILDEKTIIKKNVAVLPGSIIGQNVILGPHLSVEKGSLIHLAGEAKSFDLKVVGDEGRGAIYESDEEDEEEEEDQDNVLEKWGKPLEEYPEEYYSSDSECSGSNVDHVDHDDVDNGLTFETDDARKYYIEALDSLLRGISENILWKNLIVELNASKHAYNIQYSDLSSLISRAIMEAIIKSAKTDGQLSPGKIKSIAMKLVPLIKNYIKDTQSQKDCLKAMEEFTLCEYTASMIAAMVQLINVFYNEDILDEEIILHWFKASEAVYSSVHGVEHDPSKQKLLRSEKIVIKLIEWLEQAEEESDSE